MTIEDALVIVDAVLKHKPLNTVQEIILRQCWEGKKYQEIAETSGYDAAYIRDVGYRLWQILTEATGERVRKSNLQTVFRRQAIKMGLPPMAQAQGTSPTTVPFTYTSSIQVGNGGIVSPVTRLVNQSVTEPTLSPTCDMANVNPKTTDVQGLMPNIIKFRKPKDNRQSDWGNAVDTTMFFGREQELAIAKQLLIGEPHLEGQHQLCRLMGIFGMGGIGKTAFAVKLAEQIQDDFEYIIWRSLRNAPPIEETLADLVRFVSNQQEVDLPSSPDRLLSRLVHYLRTNRCLIILDNVESILQSGAPTGSYRPGYEGYGELFKQVSEIRHQSCLLLTSRERPAEFSVYGDESFLVRSLYLEGLQPEAQSIFLNGLQDSASDTRQKLINHYRGNPLAIRVVSRSIQELFDGNIAEFLEHGTSVIGDVRHLIEQQYSRLSPVEKQIMYCLAISREPVAREELLKDLPPIISKPQLLDALACLKWRSLVETTGNQFTQQPVVMEYVTEQVIEQAYQAIVTGTLDFLVTYALVKPKAKDYVYQNQIRAIVRPLATKLIANFGTRENLHEHLHQLIEQLQNPTVAPSYGLLNVSHLLHQLQIKEVYTPTDFPVEVTDLSDLHILQRLLESNRPGGLATWDHRIPWANNPLSQATCETKTQICSKNLYYQWIEGSLEELQYELKQQGKLRKSYSAWLNDRDFAEIDAEFEAVQITDALDRKVDARLVFMNEVRIIQPPVGLPTPFERRAAAHLARA